MSDRLPFAGVGRLLIDGNNLLHRTSGSAGAGQVRLLLARLRQAVPAEVATLLMLDGHPAPGTGRRQRVAANLEVHHAGTQTADDALVGLLRAEPPHTRGGQLLVSDDRALVERARTLGARTQRLAWLEALLTGGAGAGGRSAAVGLGSGRRPSPRPTGRPAPEHRAGDEDEREPWRPGRGATRKRGNPRRAPRHRR